MDHHHLRSQVVKKFPAFMEYQGLITAFTRARRPSLCIAKSIQSMRPSHFLEIHFNIILPFKPGSSKWSLSLRISHRNPICTYPLPHTYYWPRQFHFFEFDHPNNIWWEVRIIKLLITLFLQSTVTSSLLGPSIPFNTLFSNTLNLVPPSTWANKFHIHTEQQAKL